MHRYFFYISPDKIHDNTAILKGDEFRHCIYVLRKKTGDEISLFNGRGEVFTAIIDRIAKKYCEYRIISTEKIKKPISTDIILAFGLIKSKALDLLIREASALGVSQFVPLLTQHSVKQGFNSDRMQKIAIESLKQSGSFYLPEIHEPVEFSDWLDMAANVPVKLVAEQDHSISLQTALKKQIDHKTVAILIGPEGGLHSDEVEFAVAKGFIPVSIHPYRLRTELAAIVAITRIYAYIN
ncbi:MAG: 16S rRNA (uracil(1498)-N(3))-methyltransferase [Candidatus Marinimicrobia bacterium]|nr:16S rRNA (uracil(1498)-N(3))-methyltransferase [Candidatus Neomarinimicrobiota bacterium]